MKIHSYLSFLFLISMIISCNVQNQSDGNQIKSNDLSEYPELKGHIRSFTSKLQITKFVKGNLEENRSFSESEKDYDSNGFLLSRKFTVNSLSQLEKRSTIYSYYYLRDDEYNTKTYDKLIENMNDNEVIIVRTFRDDLEVKVEEYEKGLKIEETSKLYNTQNDLSKEIKIFYPEDKTRSIKMFESYYYYDHNSNLIKTETISKGELIQKQEMYFKDNRMVKKTSYSVNSFPETSLYEFTYYPSGIIKEKVVHMGSSPHKILFDENGLRDMLVTMDEFSDKLCIYFYKYDHMGNWTERIKDYTELARKTGFSKNSLVIEERIFEYY
jgi:hypothetical protein